ncbi:hypothetical protein P8631_01005 [Guyparkeria sp. 1SP6A2]|nr:hypothetical protein [Guyparkeria sp. 1SP6A2]
MNLSRSFLAITLVAWSFAANGGEESKGLSLDGVENHEAVIPPQCYTRTDGRFNPCFTCHQSYDDKNRPNFMDDARLQAEYDFADFAMTNRWSNLFKDRSQQVAAISDEEILGYIAEDNYSALAGRLESMGWEGFVPDLDALHLGSDAFDEHGFARDGSGWVAFNYKPLPSTFWPTNGSTDDVLIRLPEQFRQARDCRGEGGYSVDAYRANLAILEAAIKDLPEIESLPVDENAVCADLDGDGKRSVVTQIQRPSHYVGDAAHVSVATMLYPAGSQFLHTVRYVGVAEDGRIAHTPRMKEVRYMKKLSFHDRDELREIYEEGEEGRGAGDREEEGDHGDEGNGEDVLPGFADTGHGLANDFGWLVLGFIEDKKGELRPQTKEEQLFCMGCHSTIGATLDQTFAFPRKVTGAEGWGYIDLKGMPDAPNVGEIDGEILTYLERVGGGSEFRHNPEMQARWFNDESEVKRDKVEAADVYTLITPSPERALRLNKAYRVIVEEQSYIHGRDATVVPPENVYEQVDASEPPLPEEFRYDWDIRLDWPTR